MQILIKNTIIIIVLTVFSSCSDKRDFETYINHLGIDFSDSYEIDSITQIGFTDWTLKAYVRISDNDKNKILNKIKAEKTFPFVSTEKEYFEKHYQKEDSIHGFIIGAKYFYGKYETRYAKIGDEITTAGYQTYDFEFDTINNKMFFKYEYE